MSGDIPLTTYVGSVGPATGTFTINTSGTPVYPYGTPIGGVGIGIATEQTYTINPNDTFNWNTFVENDPIQKQIDVLTEFMNEYKAESELRKKYPALEYAYEQYEIMLEICKAKEADDAAGENSKNP